MSGAGNKENSRAEEFKRATAGALRAIAEVADVQVAFQPGPSGIAGKRARLPLPTRALEWVLLLLLLLLPAAPGSVGS